MPRPVKRTQRKTPPPEPPPLLVDPRVGSRDLLPLLLSLAVPARLSPLESADFAFTGLGPGFRPTRIGIERKRLSDLITSIESGRFASTQLPRLKSSYDQTWLVVEGVWRSGKSGRIEVWKRNKVGRGGRWYPYDFGGIKSADQIEAWLLTATIKAGVHVIKTGRREETAEFIARLYRWWNCENGWEGHNSHRAIDQVAHLVDKQYLAPLDLGGEIASRLPGIGPKLCRVVQDSFETPLDMALAGIAQWSAIQWESARGRKMRVGRAKAVEVWAAWRTRADGTVKIR